MNWMSRFRLAHNRPRKYGLAVVTAKQLILLSRTVVFESLVCYTQTHETRSTSLPLTMECRELLVSLTFVGRILQRARSSSFQPEFFRVSKKHMRTK